MTESAQDVRVPLTPAEQMLMIRRAVIGGDNEPVGAGGIQILATYLHSADHTEQQLRDLENHAWVRESTFQSHAPVIAKLIVFVRNLWNWMSAKWYVLPMLQQQNGFNVAATQIIRQLWALNRSQFTTICALQERVEALEAQLAQLIASPTAEDK